MVTTVTWCPTEIVDLAAHSGAFLGEREFLNPSREHDRFLLAFSCLADGKP